VTVWPHLLTYHERCQQQVENALGKEVFDAAFRYGHNLTIDNAIAYALGERTEPLSDPGLAAGPAVRPSPGESARWLLSWLRA
jgi:hypothetical protein